MKIISASIDLTKIDKTRISKFDKDGNPHKNGAQYYNIDIIVNDEKNQFGQDTSISTALTTEEREAKAKKTFIGNGKTVFSKAESSPTRTASDAASEVKETKDDDTDLPFTVLILVALCSMVQFIL